MDKQSYAKYLLQLLDDEKESDEPDIDEALFYGYFQMYMPDGKGVEATFKPLEDGPAYLQRILQIYEMLAPEEFNGSAAPGYFTRKAGNVPNERLILYGKQFIRGLKELLLEASTKVDTVDSANYLLGIEEVRIVPPGSLDGIRQQYDPEIYETIFDIISEQKEYDEPIEVLDEAYYSIACDYWISYYLQWPRYGLNGDPFASYFKLYRRGYSAIFSENKLYIGS
ncbi:hypothetical protein [Ureibacillus sinduriensis]|uniref:Uncharacterized protein n=1 Tax=Ureibacillus sinduriensis BLB-1 = JCM 15800 TaxID=1384057 RepID=A0A0A3IJB7_9BACL|nr:hypothetical protein [Ureibacillus sinduriensis]KGR74967.1 hypothetical protein CD33_14660 [Ureibacillus sinduriensis BLB-1 = JCM 15800]